jgi:hypothetical protein
MTDLDSAVLSTLRSAWPGHPFKLRLNKLAAAVSASPAETFDSLGRLASAGELSFFVGRGRSGGRHIALRNPPTEPPTLFAGGFTPIPKDKSCNTPCSNPPPSNS